MQFTYRNINACPRSASPFNLSANFRMHTWFFAPYQKMEEQIFAIRRKTPFDPARTQQRYIGKPVRKTSSRFGEATDKLMTNTHFAQE
ncbi:MAG: hypothetical protein AAGG48_31085 [Planctomycetota bacterium]